MGRGQKNRPPENQFPSSSTISWRLPVDAVFQLVDILSINTKFNIHIISLVTFTSKMVSANVDQAIQSALDFLATRERSVVLKREQKQAIVRLLNGEDVLAVLPSGFGKSMIFTVFGIAESEKLEGRPVSVLVKLKH